MWDLGKKSVILKWLKNLMMNIVKITLRTVFQSEDSAQAKNPGDIVSVHWIERKRQRL